MSPTPHDAVSGMFNLVKVYEQLGMIDESAAVARRILDIDPQHLGAYNQLGNAALRLGNCALASEFYHSCSVAAGYRTGEPLAKRNSETFSQLISCRQNLGQSLLQCDRYDAAVQVLSNFLEAGSGVLDASTKVSVNALLIAARRTSWDFSSHEVLARAAARLETAARQLRNRNSLLHFDADGQLSGLTVYDVTMLPVSAQSHAFAARVAIAEDDSVEPVARAPASNQLHSGKRIRVGYVSYDLRAHVMGYMLSGLFTYHDRAAVEVFCYYYGPKSSERTLEIAALCDTFRDMTSASDLDIAHAIRDDEVNILIDTMGHTTGRRTRIATLQPAALAVNYLGFPGTMGSARVDFIAVDKVVLPVEEKSTASEARLVLPYSYQANNYESGVPVCAGAGLAAGCMSPMREQHGLPLDAARVVLANFNTVNKLDRDTLHRWLRIMRRMPSSVLLLLEPGNLVSGSDGVEAAGEEVEAARKAVARLHAEAAAEGIHPSRIRLAPKLPRIENLQRYNMIDLFLDSHIYTAHSTAGDALWGQAPLLTCGAPTFPGRVASSLLHAVGLPHLIAHSMKDFEDTAVRLGESAALRAQLRSHLATAALRAPAFDTALQTSNLERGLRAAWEQRSALPRLARGSPSRTSRSGDPGLLSTSWHVVVNPAARKVPISEAADDTSRLHRRIARVLEHARSLIANGDAVAASGAIERVLWTDPHNIGALQLQQQMITNSAG